MEEKETFTWDEEFTVCEVPEFVCLPKGVYEFTIVESSLGRFNGSDKLPPCDMAEVRIAVEGDEGKADITDRFYCCKKMKYKLSSFLQTIGLVHAGDRIMIDWPKLVGRKGRVSLSKREYNGREYNQVDFYVLPKDQVTHTPF